MLSYTGLAGTPRCGGAREEDATGVEGDAANHDGRDVWLAVLDARLTAGRMGVTGATGATEGRLSDGLREGIIIGKSDNRFSGLSVGG